MTDRLLYVHILAGSNRIDGHLNVPVIRRADHYGVDIVLAELDGERARAAAADIERLGAATLVHVADVAHANVLAMKAGAAELIPLLSHKTLKVPAKNALSAIGPDAVSDLFNGMESDNADQRVACYTVAAAVTKYAKGKGTTFWKTGPDEERKTVLAQWKEWWDKQQQPKSKSTGIEKKP